MRETPPDIMEITLALGSVPFGKWKETLARATPGTHNGGRWITAGNSRFLCQLQGLGRPYPGRPGSQVDGGCEVSLTGPMHRAH